MFSIIERKLVLAQLLGHLLRLFGVERLLRLFDERQDIAHAEDARSHAVRMERFERLELLAEADELDGHARHGLDGKRRAAARIAVELRHDDAVEAERLIEALRHIDAFLARHRIDDEQDFVRMHGALDVAELLHELLVNLQAAGRIDDDDVIHVRLRIGHSLVRNLDRILAAFLLENGKAELLADDFELRDGGRTVDVIGHEQRALALLLEREAELADRRRLAGALQARHHDDRRRLRAHVDAALRAAHERREFLIDNLDDDLRRRQRLEDFLADCAFLDRLDEVLDDLEIDIGFEERHADFPHRLVDIVLRQLAMTAQLLERLLQTVG